MSKLLELLLVVVLPLGAFGAGWKTHGDIVKTPAVVVTKDPTAPVPARVYAEALCRLDGEYLAAHSAGQLAELDWSSVPREAVGACERTRYLGAIDPYGRGDRMHLFVLTDRLGREMVRAIVFDADGFAVWIQ